MGGRWLNIADQLIPKILKQVGTYSTPKISKKTKKRAIPHIYFYIVLYSIFY